MTVLLAALLVASAASVALAQGFDGTLRGEVKDPKGLAIDGAKITIRDEATGAERHTTTASGTFNAPNLLVGTYTITVEIEGFKKYVRKGVEVKSNQVTEVAISLELGSVTTVVEVTASGELVQTTSSQLGGTWSGREANELPLPLGGDPQNLALLMTGTTTQSGGVVGAGGAIGGNRPRNNSFVVDGVDNNDVTVTGPLQPLIPDAVAEFTLLTNQFSAEYGHSTAGQFITNTKSGTNAWHGSGFWFVNNRDFNSVDNITKESIASGGVKPRYDLNRGGGTVGGPILKDKIFVFGAYQYTTQGQAAQAGNAFSVPTAAGFATLSTLASAAGTGVKSTAVSALTAVLTPAPTQNGTVVVCDQRTAGSGASACTTGPAGSTPGTVVNIPVGDVAPSAPSFFKQHDFQVNGDITWWKNHRISMRYFYDQFRSPDTSAFPIPVFTGSFAVDNRSAVFSDVYTITPHVVNEFRAGYRRNVLALTVPSLTPPGTLDVYPNMIIEELGGLELGPDGNGPQSGVINQYQWVDTLSWAKGRHNLKLGADARLWIAPTNFLPRARAEYRYSGLDRFVKDLVPDNLGLRGAGDGLFAGNQKGIFWFVQDDWKIHPRVTLNLGIRYEFTTTPRDDLKQTLNTISNLLTPTNTSLRQLIFSNPKQDLNNFAPRVGFAWDLFGNHKTSIRGGFGVAYDVIFQNLPLLSLPPQLQKELDADQACLLASPKPSWCVAGATAQVDTAQNFLAGGAIPFFPPSPATLDQATARATTQGLITDVVAPKTLTWSLAVQHEFGKDYSVEVRYVGTRGISLPVQIRRNPRPTAATFLPTFFKTSDVPATLPATAPTLQPLQSRVYAADGFTGGSVTAFDPIGNSIYHGGSVELTRRFSNIGRWGNGLFLKTGYTLSRAIDDSTNELFTSQVNPRRAQDFNNIPNERGLSAIHHEHKYTMAAIYELPKYAGGGPLKYLLNQWQISASYIAESGQPVTALSFLDANRNGDAAGDRAIFNPGFTNANTATDASTIFRDTATSATSIGACPAGATCTTVGYVAIDPAAQFVRARAGAFANTGRDNLFSAGINNWNLSFFKRTNITERVYVEFRTEMINAFNHPQPILGSGSIAAFTDNAINGTDLVFVGNNPSFQKPQDVLSTGAGNAPFSRIIAFGLKLFF